MRKMLEELFYGNIRPNEQSLDRNSELREAVQIYSESEDKLAELLEGKEKKLLLALLNAQGIIDGNLTVENFVKGFRLGARIALEIMSDEDGCLRDIT